MILLLSPTSVSYMLYAFYAFFYVHISPPPSTPYPVITLSTYKYTRIVIPHILLPPPTSYLLSLSHIHTHTHIVIVISYTLLLLINILINHPFLP